jgi:hypothetical protein
MDCNFMLEQHLGQKASADVCTAYEEDIHPDEHLILIGSCRANSRPANRRKNVKYAISAALILKNSVSFRLYLTPLTMAH